MKINMTAVLTSQDIAAAVAMYVAAETNNTVSAEDVAIPQDAVATVTIGDVPEANQEEKAPLKKTSKRAAPKTVDTTQIPQENNETEEPDTNGETDIPETSQESNNTEEEDKPAALKAASGTGAKKSGSIFNFERK